MAETTYEQARRCPICKEPGRDTGRTRPGPHRSTLHVIECPNSRCRWFGTTYIVQTNADGTVPPPDMHRQKSFHPLPPRDQDAVDRQMQSLLDQQLR